MTSKTFSAGTVIDSAWLNDVNTVTYSSTTNAKISGAKGDGTTDDTAVLQTALNATAGDFYFPPGTFIITQLNVPNNVTIRGAGMATVLKQKTGAAQFNSVLSISGKSNVTVRDLVIDGNGNTIPSGEHNHGINISDSTDVTVRNVVVHDCNGDSIYMESTTNSILLQRITVEDCTVYNLGRQGICLAMCGGRFVKIVNNHGRVGTYVTSSTSHGNPIHLEIDVQPTVYVGDVTIQGNILQDAGISVGGSFMNLAIVGNVIRGGANTTTFGLILCVNTYDVIVTGNTIYGDGTTLVDGIYFQDVGVVTSPSVKNISINGNTIINVGGHGIQAFGTSFGVPTAGKMNISNNVIHTVGGGGSRCGITVNTSVPDLTVHNNTIDGVTNIGIDVEGCPNFTITNNRIKEFAGNYGIYMSSKGGIGAGPGLVAYNTISHSTPAGKVGIRVENEATNTRITITRNDVAGVGAPINIGALAVKCTPLDNTTGNDALTGSFTLAAAASTVVTNANAQSYSRITLIPTNAAAATLMGSAKSLYWTITTPGTSFTVTTANGIAAAGTETFIYFIA